MIELESYGTVMIDTAWPTPICTAKLNGVHEWVPAEEGIRCETCRNVVAWEECWLFQRWCVYLMGKTLDVIRLN